MQDAQQMTTREEIEIVFRRTHSGHIVQPHVVFGRCLCGQYIKRPNMNRHLKTLRHRTYILANPDIRESRRMLDAFIAEQERLDLIASQEATAEEAAE